MKEVTEIERPLADAILNEYFPVRARVQVESLLPGWQNMQRDEDVATRLTLSADDGVYIRLYSWNPWCVSLGAHQRETDIDQVALRRRGFDLVRRATGGRAVLHANEITYSICIRLPDGVTMHDVYRFSHHRILAALQSLGARELSFEKSQPDFATQYRTKMQSVSCFTSSARNEIVWRSKKVVGSAQRRYATVLLQHGSILLGAGHEQLADVVAGRDPAEREALRQAILSQSVTLDSICLRQLTFDECADALLKAFTRK